MSTPRLLRRTPRSVWQLLLCLTVLAFVLRALVPLGFMPAAQAMPDGKLVLSFCTAGGMQMSLPMSLSNESAAADAAAADAPADAVPGSDCPFGLLAAQAMPPAPVLELLQGAVATRDVTVAFVYQALPPLPAQGPPLGSRAPPFYLG